MNFTIAFVQRHFICIFPVYTNAQVFEIATHKWILISVTTESIWHNKVVLVSTFCPHPGRIIVISPSIHFEAVITTQHHIHSQLSFSAKGLNHTLFHAHKHIIWCMNRASKVNIDSVSSLKSYFDYWSLRRTFSGAITKTKTVPCNVCYFNSHPVSPLCHVWGFYYK